jgi:hypothetical protein
MIERRLVSRPVSTIGTLIAPRVTQEEGPRIVTEGLVGHWDAGNPYSYPGTGTTWTDLSGSENTGTLTNGPTYSSDARGAFQCDGANDFIDLGSLPQLDPETKSMSVCVWVKPTNTNSTWRAVISKREGNDENQWWGMWNSAFNRWHYRIGTRVYNDPNALPVNTWKMLTLVRDRTNGTMRCYKDSTRLTSLAASLSQGTGNVFIGKAIDSPGTEFFPGLVASCWVYTEPLTDSQVFQNFQATRWRFGI